MTKKIHVYAKFDDSMGKPEDEHLLLVEDQLNVAIDKVKAFIRGGLKIYQFTITMEEGESST